MGATTLAVAVHSASDAEDEVPRRKRPPLFIDVDGTLLATDVLIESLAHAARRDTWALPSFCWCLFLRGRARAKMMLAERCSLDYATLPANSQVLELAGRWRAEGGEVWMATASAARAAEAIAKRHAAFDGVLCSDGERNLKGEVKLAAIRARNRGGFAYCGDSIEDLPILRAADERFVVHGARRLVAALDREGLSYHVLHRPRPRLVDWLRLLRLHQWLKNLVLFVPLLAAHRLGDLDVLGLVALGAIAFGLTASATYVVNDVLDLANDRAHPSKCDRPLASGLIAVPAALGVALGLGLAGFALGAWIGSGALAMLSLYAALTLAYSLKLKEYVLIDALVLAALYTVRLAAGGVIAGMVLSAWLAAFCGALFLSLALVKRCAELAMLRDSGILTRAPGRDYGVGDLPLLATMGVAAGYGAVLLLALYADSSTARSLYGTPHRLWLICPFLLYWISRLWIKTGRGEMHHDPVVYTLHDRGSLMTVAAALLVYAWSVLGG